MDKVGGVVVEHANVKLNPPSFGYLPLSITNSGDWIRFGLVSDTHLACKEERLDVLHNAYDTFAAEKIVNVLHGGNPVDGYVPKINGGSVFETSIDGQAQYFLDKYPARKNIITHFVSGDDHEGWWMKEGFSFGAYLMFLAQSQGRKDLNYLGHVEADIEVRAGKKPTMIKLQHPGMGSSYARSYSGQKTVESLQSGEKPAILIQGHYHLANYMNERAIHVINLPGMQSQTIFARKKRLRMEIGYAILEFKVNPEDGSVTRCRVEFTMFWDRGYHQKFLKSDGEIVKGHLIIKP